MLTTVQTKLGTIEGIEQGPVICWRGIPYAQPPTGSRRFQPPQPATPWTGVRSAKQFGPIPMQAPLDYENPINERSEDCLYLNVQAPVTPGPARPVMVWIYGGGFQSGFSNNPWYQHPNLALLEDVVVVTFNYRLGIFGCLDWSDAPPEFGFSANLMLLDQVMALEWVRDNIAAFGGNPDQVTVFGESAGGTSVVALLAMPATKGLFHRAIVQSAADIFLNHAEINNTKVFLKAVGVSPDRLQDVLTLSANTILEASHKVPQPFGPVFGTPSLPVTPLEAFRQGCAAGIPIIIGTTLDEGHMWFTPDSPLAADFSPESVEGLLRQIYGEARAATVAPHYSRTWQGSSQLLTDLVFWLPSVRFAEALSAFAPVWMYRFDWTCPAPHPFTGAFHALEMMYMFDCLETPAALNLMGGEAGHQPLADQMRSSWGAFARGAAPQGPGLPTWSEYTAQDRMTMVFNERCHMVSDPRLEMRAIFNGE